MKLSQLILALSVSISGAAFAADNHGHDLKPMHGGAVAEAKEVEYEFVASADKLQLYMRDHGKPVAVTGMTAKVTLLAGSEKQEVQLQVGDQASLVSPFPNCILAVSRPYKRALPCPNRSIDPKKS